MSSPPSTLTSHSSSNQNQNLRLSILITLSILTITVLISVSLWFLLRHLNRRCLRHLSSTSSLSSATPEPRLHSTHRVSPETLESSLIDSLPVFTFKSVTTTSRSNSSSAISGDCAVCLSKFEPEDQLRLLPLCCHAFHADCIDTWLKSNQTCPLCRSPLYASDSDLRKVLLASSGGVGGGSENSFRLEIGSISRRQIDSGEQRRSYSIGSFDYVLEADSDISIANTHRINLTDKEEASNVAEAAQAEQNLAEDVGNNSRNWLKEYVDRLSSRAMSFRSSGRYFTGSSRRNEITGTGDCDLEANRAGEEISELFRWLSGV